MQRISDIRLNDRIALVTGAAAGLGRAMALALARAGASVLFVDLDGVKAQTAALSMQGVAGAGLV